MEKLYVTSVKRQHKILKLMEPQTLVLKKEERKIRLVRNKASYSFFTIGELRLYRGNREKADRVITKLIGRGFVDIEVEGRL